MNIPRHAGKSQQTSSKHRSYHRQHNTGGTLPCSSAQTRFSGHFVSQFQVAAYRSVFPPAERPYNGFTFRKPFIARRPTFKQKVFQTTYGKDVIKKLAPILKHTDLRPDFVKDVLLPNMPSEKAGILIAGVLLSAARRKGTREIGHLWRKSELKWSWFIGPHSCIYSYIKKHKLEFTKEDLQVVIEEIENNLKLEKELLDSLKRGKNNQQISTWINANIVDCDESTFVRMLVSAVIENAISVEGLYHKLDRMKLKCRMPLLSHYIAHNEHLESHALYVLQILANQIGQESAIPGQIFNIMYHYFVISEEGFHLWSSKDDPNMFMENLKTEIMVNSSF